jgi:LPXTG-motif cell wall-anchored protein
VEYKAGELYPKFGPTNPNPIQDYYAVYEATAFNTVDTATGVVISAPAGVVPPAARLVVEAKTNAASPEYEQAATALADVAEDFLLFDIKLLLEGAEIQPNGDVSLSIPVPADFDPAKTKVFYIADDGAKKELASQFVADPSAPGSKGYIAFETNHFSNYALAHATIDNTTVAANTNNAASTLPSTGDGTGWLLLLGIALAGAGIALIAYRRQQLAC